MTGYIDAAPAAWKHNLSLSGVYRDRVPKHESFELAAEGKVRHWGQDFSFDSPVSVEVEANRADEYVILDITVSARVSTACSRCLEPAGVAIKGNLRYLFSLRTYLESLGDEQNAPDGDAGREEIIPLASWDEAINVGELAWETLITALPGAALCSDECKGLCPQCGANLNKTVCGCKTETGDPRFEALKELLDDEA